MDANASWLWAFDPTAGTGGMLLVAARALKELNPDIEVVLAGQELMSTGYAIGKADLVIQGGEPDAIRHGDTLLNDLYEGEQFEYILSNPPFGMDWEVQQQSVKQQAKVPGSRFSHGLPSKDDGQMLFLAHVASKLMPAGPNGSGGRGAVVSNGSPLFTGAPESGPDKIRAWLLENDLVDAIIQLPTNMFYGTGISTYVWILDTNKEEHRKGFVQLIDASECWSVPEKGLGEKRREMKEPDRKRVLEEYAAFEDTEISKVLTPADLGFRDVKVTKQKRLRVAVTLEAVARVLEHKYTVSEQANVADMRFNDLPEALKAAAKKRGVKILAGIIDVVLEAVGVSDEKSKGYDFRSLVAFADVERAFKDDEQDYRVIIVANKFQTGFNEPRLCAMYVDKQLSGVTTVQTLSRLNRIHENKPTPMVVDFVNDPEMIVKDFKRYYEGAAINTDIDPNALHTLGEELDTSGFYTPEEMEQVAQIYMDGTDSEALRGAAAPIIRRWQVRRNSGKDGRADVRNFKSNAEKYRHAYEFLSQIVAYADAEVSKRAMLAAVLERNLHFSEYDDEDEDFITGLSLAGVAITQNEIEVDRSLTDGGVEALKVPTFDVTVGGDATPLRAAFDEAVDKVNDIFSMAGVDVTSGETAQMIVAAWGTLSTQPEALKLGRTNNKDQLKRSKRFQDEATKAIFSGIAERQQRDALLSSDRDVLHGVIGALAELMAAAKEMGKLDE